MERLTAEDQLMLWLIANVSLGVGALSYAEQFNIMAVADKDACPDLDIFTASVRDELRALTASTPAKPEEAVFSTRPTAGIG